MRVETLQSSLTFFLYLFIYFFTFSMKGRGQCYTFGSNQHGQLGTSAHRNSRVPYLISAPQGLKVTMVACGDAFTVAVCAGEFYIVYCTHYIYSFFMTTGD